MCVVLIAAVTGDSHNNPSLSQHHFVLAATVTGDSHDNRSLSQHHFVLAAAVTIFTTVICHVPTLTLAGHLPFSPRPPSLFREPTVSVGRHHVVHETDFPIPFASVISLFQGCNVNVIR
ncbi:hypothetical protein P8452_06143 [Trifolium repens]|nr:hypothetical protein P8452_06143 [Trifolium repens]